MAEVAQYSFTHKELVELMIKATGVHEGHWGLLVQMNLAQGIMGPGPSDLSPGVMMLVQKIGIQRLASDVPHQANLTVDAAVVNPKP